jgi:tetratricopeptide (TPR) repeat protein
MDLLSLFNSKQYQSIVDYSLSPQYVLSLNPNDGRIIAASHYFLGNYIQAVEICSQVYSVLNGDADFLGLYGSSLRKSGDLNAASSLYSEALDLHPNSLLLKNNFANLLIDLSEYSRARKLLDSVISAAPDYADAISNLSRLEFCLSQNVSSPQLSDSNSVQYDPLDAAFTLEEVKRTFSVIPKNNTQIPSASVGSHSLFDSLPHPEPTLEQMERINLSRSYLSTNPQVTLSEAHNLYKELGPHPLVYILAGDAYVRLKLFADAENCFHSALSLGSTDPSVHINLANLSHMRGDQLLSYRFLELVSCSTPDYPQLSKVKELLFASGKPTTSTSPFQFNPEHVSKGYFS